MADDIIEHSSALRSSGRSHSMASWHGRFNGRKPNLMPRASNAGLKPAANFDARRCVALLIAPFLRRSRIGGSLLNDMTCCESDTWALCAIITRGSDAITVIDAYLVEMK